MRIHVKILAFALVSVLLGSATASAQPGGRPPGGPGGFGGPGGRGGADFEQDALDKLKLTGSVKDKAQRVLDEHDRTTRRMLDKTRQEFLKPMKELLTVDQFVKFQDGLNARPGGARPVSVDDMVERILACDKSNRGMVAKEDLPERMQHLVALGDTNKDGYLDRDEIKQLAIKLGQQGRGPNQARPFSPADAERSLGQLGLNGESREKARSLVAIYKEATRTVTDERRTELVKRMTDVLSETQLTRFKDSLESRPRRPV
jgi:hypothetical protein